MLSYDELLKKNLMLGTGAPNGGAGGSKAKKYTPVDRPAASNDPVVLFSARKRPRREMTPSGYDYERYLSDSGSDVDEPYSPPSPIEPSRKRLRIAGGAWAPPRTSAPSPGHQHAATAPSPHPGRQGGAELPALVLPPNGQANEATFQFLLVSKMRVVALMDQQDKSDPQYKEMMRFLAEARRLREQIKSNVYGTAGERSMSLPARIPTEQYQEIVLRLTTAHQRGPRCNEPFVLPPKLRKEIQWMDIMIKHDGICARNKQTFYPEGHPTFSDIDSRKKAYNACYSRNKRMAERVAKGHACPIPGCTKAGPVHGTQVIRQFEQWVEWVWRGGGQTAIQFMLTVICGEMDYCTMALIVYMDMTGRIPQECEVLVSDLATKIITPIDVVVWQCPGFAPPDKQPPGCHFIEVKSGFACGDFVNAMPGDRTMQHLENLYDTPYMRAVLQLVGPMIFAQQRAAKYVPQAGFVFHMDQLNGMVHEDLLPPWVQDPIYITWMYKCMIAHTSYDHLMLIMRGLQVDNCVVPGVSLCSADGTSSQADEMVYTAMRLNGLDPVMGDWSDMLRLAEASKSRRPSVADEDEAQQAPSAPPPTIPRAIQSLPALYASG